MVISKISSVNNKNMAVYFAVASVLFVFLMMKNPFNFWINYVLLGAAGICGGAFGYELVSISRGIHRWFELGAAFVVLFVIFVFTKIQAGDFLPFGYIQTVAASLTLPIVLFVWRKVRNWKVLLISFLVPAIPWLPLFSAFVFGVVFLFVNVAFYVSGKDSGYNR